MAGRHTMPAPGQTPKVKQGTHGSGRDGPTAASAHRRLLANTNLPPPGSARRPSALIFLLALNGWRVSEATGADIEHLSLERGTGR